MQYDIKGNSCEGGGVEFLLYIIFKNRAKPIFFLKNTKSTNCVGRVLILTEYFLFEKQTVIRFVKLPIDIQNKFNIQKIINL